MRRHPSAFPAAAAVASSAAVILLASPSVLAEVVTIAAEPEETAAVVQEWTVPEVQVQVHPEPVVVQMEPIAITIPTATNPEVVVYDGPDYFADEPEPEPEPEPEQEPLSAILGEYVECDCPEPSPNGAVYLAKNCEEDEPRTDECLIDVVDFEAVLVQPLPSEPLSIKADCIAPSFEPRTFSLEDADFVECPCPDNQLRCQYGQEEMFYFTDLDVGAGEKCPKIVTDIDLCPPVVISMVSQNPPVMCPCDDNPDGLMEGEWYQGLGGCDDGPGPLECPPATTNLLVEPPRLEEVDCACPYPNDDGAAAWYEIDPAHLTLDADGDPMCPDAPPDGEGLECPPDPRYLGPPLAEEEGPAATKGGGPPPGKGPRGGGGPPGRKGGPSPGRKGGPSPGKRAKKGSTAATAAGQEQGGRGKGQAYAIWDKFCNEDECLDVLGLRRRRRRRLRLRSGVEDAGRRRRTKSAVEQCELLERKYKEITLTTLECEVNV